MSVRQMFDGDVESAEAVDVNADTLGDAGIHIHFTETHCVTGAREHRGKWSPA